MDGSSPSKQAPSYYPINIEIAGKKVFVFGGQKDALAEVTRLLDFGARVDVVAPRVMAELQDLSITYGGRANIFRRAFSQDDQAKIKAKEYLLVFALDTNDAGNCQVIQSAQDSSVLVFGTNNALLSSFIMPSILKRGHLKISVSADALSLATERAIVQRIEASFVNHIDKYILFLNRLRETLDDLRKDPAFQSQDNLLQIMSSLYDSQEIFLALQRQSFDEAKVHVERIISSCKLGQEETA